MGSPDGVPKVRRERRKDNPSLEIGIVVVVKRQKSFLAPAVTESQIAEIGTVEGGGIGQCRGLDETNQAVFVASYVDEPFWKPPRLLN